MPCISFINQLKKCIKKMLATCFKMSSKKAGLHTQLPCLSLSRRRYQPPPKRQGLCDMVQYLVVKHKLPVWREGQGTKICAVFSPEMIFVSELTGVYPVDLLTDPYIVYQHFTHSIFTPLIVFSSVLQSFRRCCLMYSRPKSPE